MIHIFKQLLGIGVSKKLLAAISKWRSTVSDDELTELLHREREIMLSKKNQYAPKNRKKMKPALDNNERIFYLSLVLRSLSNLISLFSILTIS